MSRMTTPAVIRLATGAHQATDNAGREDLALLPERLDQIDAWIEGGLLNGPELNAADFQIASTSQRCCSSTISQASSSIAPPRPLHVASRLTIPATSPAVLPTEWLAPLRTATETAHDGNHDSRRRREQTTA